METGIIREANESEKKDYIEIGKKKTFEQIFRDEINKKESEMTKLHKPFDRIGAYYDFEDKKKAVMNKYQRQYGEGAFNYIKYDEIKIDVDEYAKPSRFKLLDEAEVREDKLLDGIRVSVITGKWQNFQCVHHSGKLSVFIPLQGLKTTEELEKSSKKVTELK